MNPWASSTWGLQLVVQGIPGSARNLLGNVSHSQEQKSCWNCTRSFPFPSKWTGSPRGFGRSVRPYLTFFQALHPLPTLLIPREGPSPGGIPVPLPLPTHSTL